MRLVHFPRAQAGTAVALFGELYNDIADELERQAKLDVAAPLRLVDDDRGRTLSVSMPSGIALEYGLVQQTWTPASGNAISIKPCDASGNLKRSATATLVRITMVAGVSSSANGAPLVHAFVEQGDVVAYVPFAAADNTGCIGVAVGLSLVAAPTAIYQVLQCYAVSGGVALKFDYPRSHP